MSSAKGSKALKAELRRLLEAGDLDAAVSLYGGSTSVLRLLISLTYDKTDPVSWRAMEAIGLITAGLPEEEARNTIQRLLWMMREESGTNPWSAGETLAEILRANPGPFRDIIPIVISFHDEKILRTGALRTIARVADVEPELVSAFAGVALEYLESDDPVDRGYAVLALRALGDSRHLSALEKLKGDKAMFSYYDGTRMVEETIGRLSSEAAATLGS